jgi:cysteine-rich repeat protein
MRNSSSFSSVVVTAAGFLFGTRAARCCFLAMGALCTACPVDDVVDGCGNGFIEADEECDDGNTEGGDGCDAVCLIEAGFECVGTNCNVSVCGDGIIAGAEQCDDGTANGPGYGGCTANCKLGPYCGDGVIDAGIEQCDDGVNVGGPGLCAPGCIIGSP